MKDKPLTEAEALAQFRSCIGFDINRRDLAKILGCSDSYVHFMLNGQRALSDAALAYLGLRREVINVYHRVPKGKP